MREAIILAGGMGKRLRSVVRGVPKPMADVKGRPFLAYILDYLAQQSVDRVILSVGYKHEIIRNFFGNSFTGMEVAYSIETEPLGTGGAVMKSLPLASTDDVLILNGDTYFPAPLDNFFAFHEETMSSFSIALKQVVATTRYGSVKIDNNGSIKGFTEKQEVVEGLINAGLYIVKLSSLGSYRLPQKFSLEKDFLERFYNSDTFFGKSFDNFFIDIGIPEDYLRFIDMVSIGRF